MLAREESAIHSRLIPLSIATSLPLVPFKAETWREVWFSHTDGANDGADQPIAAVGASMYLSISDVALSKVILKPGPSRLVIKVPDSTLEILRLRSSERIISIIATNRHIERLT